MTCYVYPANLEVLVVLLVIPVQHVEVLRKLLRPRELVHVDEGVMRRRPSILLFRGAHHYREHIPTVTREKF